MTMTTTVRVFWVTCMDRNLSKGAIMLKNRLNYNVNNDTFWVSEDKAGLVHFFAPKSYLTSTNFRYLSRNEREDSPVHQIKDILLVDNDPLLYIRYIHGDNTSLYVNPHQEGAKLNCGPYTEPHSSDFQHNYCKEKSQFVRNN